MISDADYQLVQQQVQVVSQMLLGLDRGLLKEFLVRAQRAQSVGPVLHPSEWMAASRQLDLIVANAATIARARGEIVAAAEQAGVVV